jgi:hypothetical protein
VHLVDPLARQISKRGKVLRREAQRVIQFAVSQQPRIGGDHGTAKLQQQTTIEIEPQSALICFTRRVRHRCHIRSPASS